MKEYSMNGKLKQVPSNLIFADKYQRPVEMKRVSNIVQKFNPAIMNPIKISYRDNCYWVFDGQHTLAALKVMNGGEDLMVPCRAYEELTYEDEAYLFAQQFGDSRDVDVQCKLNALNEAKDADVVNMRNLVNSLGFEFDFTRKQAPKKIIASATLWRVYQNSTQQEFIDILEIICDSWNFNPNSLKKEILGGVHYFYTYPEYRRKINKKLAIRKLSPVDPFIIIRDSNIYSFTGDKRYARTISEIYNKGLKSNRLPHEIY